MAIGLIVIDDFSWCKCFSESISHFL